ncbi:MAG: PIN domain-containing protein [Gammaproteobacteria bacterium]|nr:PIN domain-containing protein [Gammaproteobacteria bacterium]
MILMDTGPIAALFNPADSAHKKCIRVLEPIKEPVSTTIPVLAEAFHLMHAINPGTIGLMDFINNRGLQVLDLDRPSLTRCFELMVKYADRAMDFADASLVAMAEKHQSRTIFTLDRNDFSTYRIRKGHRHLTFEVIGC